jgi:inner membrane protein
MPSAIGHVAPALALIPLFSQRDTPKRLWLLGVLCAAAPDLDVLAFRFGVPYEHVLGHRGLWHSIPFAAVFASFVCLVAFPRPLPSFSRVKAWGYLFLATASHGLLDTLTNGGLASHFQSVLQSPLLLSARPIEVSPLSCRAFFRSAVLHSRQ